MKVYDLPSSNDFSAIFINRNYYEEQIDLVLYKGNYCSKNKLTSITLLGEIKCIRVSVEVVQLHMEANLNLKTI